ncbi:MAG: hypothetical protein PHE54_03420 [Bacilli bacterium]|nr:hypothetical protein [Bacilli bacterium]
MSLIDKVKNLFSDEIEDEPVKKEVIKVEIPSPTKENKPIDNEITDNETIKKEEKVNFPVYFDDKDFDTMDYKPKEKEPIKSSYMLKKPKEEKKPFKPSPIISPVYGVLDKNYSKDDIKTKNHNKETPLYRSKQITIDEVRKKAYGTLEQDLEDVMSFANGADEDIKINNFEDDTIDIFEELDHAEEEKLHNDEINYNNLGITIEEAEKKQALNDEEEIKEMFEEDKNLTEGDLFDLIDSMYEKGEHSDE